MWPHGVPAGGGAEIPINLTDKDAHPYKKAYSRCMSYSSKTWPVKKANKITLHFVKRIIPYLNVFVA